MKNKLNEQKGEFLHMFLFNLPGNFQKGYFWISEPLKKQLEHKDQNPKVFVQEIIYQVI